MAVPWVYAEVVSSEFGTIFFDEFNVTGRPEPGDHVAALNRLGALGWEVYAVHVDGAHVSTRFYLKKSARRRRSD